MGRSKKGSSKAEEEFRKWAEHTLGRMIETVVLRVDELSSKVMNSKEKKQELASQLNEWAVTMLYKVAAEIEANKVGFAGRSVTIRPGTAPMRTDRQDYLAEGKGLKPNYLARKLKEKQLQEPHYFKFSGLLSRNLAAEANIRQFSAEDIRVFRSVEDETWHKKKDGGYEKRKVIRNALGQFASKTSITEGWTIEVAPHPLFRLGELNSGYTQAEATIKTLYPDDEDMQAKLLGYGKPYRPYRPLLEDYLHWFTTTLIPDMIREAYQAPRARRKK